MHHPTIAQTGPQAIRQLAGWYNSTDVQVLRCHQTILAELVGQFESSVAPAAPVAASYNRNDLKSLVRGYFGGVLG